MTEFISRVGTFFLLVGLGLEFMFFASDSAAAGTSLQANYNFLCVGTIFLSLGIILRIRGAPPRESSGRFRTVRNWRDRRRKRREERIKAKQQKK